MDSDQAIAKLFHDTHELEAFFHSFIGQLAKRRLKADEDVTHLAEELKLKVPAALKGVKITWAGGADTNAADAGSSRRCGRVGLDHRLRPGRSFPGLPRMRMDLLPHRDQGPILSPDSSS